MSRPAKKPDIVSDRRQSIVGAARVISTADELVEAMEAAEPKTKADIDPWPKQPMQMPRSIAPRLHLRKVNEAIAVYSGTASLTTATPPILPTPAKTVESLTLKASSSRFDIADDVPIPHGTGIVNDTYRAWLRKLKPGQFLHIAYLTGQAPDAMGSQIRKIARQEGILITCRMNVTHKGRKGLGVWRTE